MIAIHDTSSIVGQARVLVDRPPEMAFRFVGDQFFNNYPRWSPEVRELKQIGSGPVKLGTKGRQIRVDLGHRSESIFAVTVFERDRRICFEGISFHYRCDYQFHGQPMEKPTEIHFTFELAKLEIYMKPFEAMIRGAVQDGVARTVRRLKILLDGERTSSEPRPCRGLPGVSARRDSHPAPRGKSP